VLAIIFGGELPILIEVPSTTIITKIAATSDISSMVIFVFVTLIPNALLCLTTNRLCRWSFAVLCYRLRRGIEPRWEIVAFGVLVILPGIAAITVSLSSVCYSFTP
jgi:hypothetical protein